MLVNLVTAASLWVPAPTIPGAHELTGSAVSNSKQLRRQEALPPCCSGAAPPERADVSVAQPPSIKCPCRLVYSWEIYGISYGRSVKMIVQG